jgi:hypothetical protein
MSTGVDYFDRLPTCPDCGQILPESWRREATEVGGSVATAVGSTTSTR